jgi:hypothetical protein
MTEPTTRIRIEDISPEAPEDVIVAIGLALETGWPEPQSPAVAVRPNEVAWRFSQRPWKVRRYRS